jgi:hypothetical protein
VVQDVGDHALMRGSRPQVQDASGAVPVLQRASIDSATKRRREFPLPSTTPPPMHAYLLGLQQSGLHLLAADCFAPRSAVKPEAAAGGDRMVRLYCRAGRKDPEGQMHG